MFFWVFIGLALFSIILMIWGLIASKKVAKVETSSEGFADKDKILVDNTEVDLDPRDGKIGVYKKFFYGKETKASGSISYSIEDMAKALKSGDAKLRFSIASIVFGVLGLVLFLSLALVSKGGNFVYAGIGLFVLLMFSLRGFFGTLFKALRND